MTALLLSYWSEARNEHKNLVLPLLDPCAQSGEKENI